MKFLYKTINDSLIDIQDAKNRCIKNNNKEDYDIIVKYYEKPFLEFNSIMNNYYKRYERIKK